MPSPIWLLFVLYLSSISGHRFLEDEDESVLPYFPAEYWTTGERISLTTQIVTPFEAWYSTEYNRSRIDYFGGMVKRYYCQPESEGTDGQKFEIHWETDQDLATEMVCYKAKPTEDLVDEAEDLLPYSDDFEYADRENIFGKDTEKWIKTTKSEGVTHKKKVETLWIMPLETTNETIPVRYEIEKYNSRLGKLESHVVTNFFTFETSFYSEDLEIEDEDNCKYKEVNKGDLETLAFVNPHDDKLVDVVFTQYKDKHSRRYKTEHEHEMRRHILRKNLEKIIATNHKKLGYTLALNKFADRTEAELRHLHPLMTPSDHIDNGTIPFPYEEHELDKLADEFPEEYDMRVEGFISPVQGEGKCGAHWAFAVTAAIEGAAARSNGGRKIQLSEQALIDCAWGYEAKGCQGAELGKVLYFPIKYEVPTEENYEPYKEMEGICRKNMLAWSPTIKGFTRVTPMNENALKVAIYNHGPVAVSIYASDNMYLYSGGIFYDTDCENEQHKYNRIATIVGYGEKLGQTYWIVKNSLGQDWGSGGYIMMSAKNNNCLVESGPYYVIV